MPSVAIIGSRGYPSYYGGFETAVRRLAPYLADEGWTVSVYSRPGVTRADDPSRDARVRSIETWGIERRSLSTLSYGLSAALHARREPPDAALVMNVANGYWLPILRRAGVPTLVNVDGIEWDRAKWGSLAKRVFRSGARLTAKHGTLMVYDSLEIARRWKEEFDREGVYIPYGGDAASADHPLEPGLTHRGYVLLVARLVPENTVLEFFEAAPAIAEVCDVVIVGSTGYGGDLDQRAGELAAAHPRIRWLQHVSDDNRLFGLWQHAGAYFHGHSVGGTNPALVQAMALGAPIVARDTVYNREVLTDGGIFVAPEPERIATALTRLVTDSGAQDAASRLSSERARAAFGWDDVLRRYAEALTSIRRGQSSHD